MSDFFVAFNGGLVCVAMLCAVIMLKKYMAKQAKF